jgi:MOSC domain-containing protein YiiM
MLSVNNSTSGAEAHLPFGGNGKSGNGSRQSGVWVLDQFTRWQSMNWDYAGKLQKAQMDVEVSASDPDFRPLAGADHAVGARPVSAAGVPDLHDRGGTGVVVAVSRSPRHRFSKELVDAVELVAGHGVEGDAHAGATVQHRSRKRWRPQLPNLRQVHLLHAELLDDLAGQGYAVSAGDVGENVLTRDVDLLTLPRGARVRLGADAVVEVTGLRNPCVQLDRFQEGLMEAVLRRSDDGSLERLAGVMGVVLAGGEVRPGDAVMVELPRASTSP